MTDFAGWFAELRKARIGTQARAAHEIGTTEKTVRTWEGKVVPSMRWAPHIARALRVPPDEVAARLSAAHLAAAATSPDADEDAPAGDPFGAIGRDEPGRRRSGGSAS